MKSVLALCLFAAAASAQYGQQSAPMLSYGGFGSSATTPIPIVRFNQNIGETSASSDFETGNGIKSQEETHSVQGPTRTMDDGYGNLVQTNSELKKSGSYSYTSPNGEVVSMSYTADSLGFHPTGSHIPVAPEMPAELKAAYAEALSRPVFVESQDSYAAAPVRSSYSAPAPVRSTYSAPAPLPVRIENTYSAPAPLPVRSMAYSAPAPAAPQIRINYAPVRSTY